MSIINAPMKNEITEKDRIQRKNVIYATQIFDYDAWFEYDLATKILNIMDTMYLEAKQAYVNLSNFEPVNEVRSLGLLLFGEINSGKTTLCIRFQNRTKSLEIEAGERWNPLNIIYFEIDCRMSLKSLLSILIEKVGGVIINGRTLQHTSTTTLIELLTKELRLNEIKILIIDEIQDLLSSQEFEIQSIFIALKKIINKSYTRLVLVGTSKAYLVLKKADETTIVSNPWVDERFRTAELKLGKNEFADLLYSLQIAYKPALPEWNPYNSKIGEWSMINKEASEIEYLFKITSGRAGKLIQLVKYAAINALLENNKKITQENYKNVFNYEYNKNGETLERKMKY